MGRVFHPDPPSTSGFFLGGVSSLQTTCKAPVTSHDLRRAQKPALLPQTTPPQKKGPQIRNQTHMGNSTHRTHPAPWLWEMPPLPRPTAFPVPSGSARCASTFSHLPTREKRGGTLKTPGRGNFVGAAGGLLPTRRHLQVGLGSTGGVQWLMPPSPFKHPPPLLSTYTHTWPDFFFGGGVQTRVG